MRAMIMSRRKFWLDQVRKRAAEISQELALEISLIGSDNWPELNDSRLLELKTTIDEIASLVETVSRPAGNKPWWIVLGIRKLSRLFLPVLYYNVVALRTISRNLQYVVNSSSERNATLADSLGILRKSLFRLETGAKTTTVSRIIPIGSGPLAKNERGLSIANAIQMVSITDGTWKYQQQSLRHLSDTLQWMKWTEASVEGQGLVIAGGSALFPHEGLAPWNFDYPGSNRFFSPHDDPNPVQWVHSERKQTFMSEAVLVTSRAPSNWFHWWVEVMSNVARVKEEFSNKTPIIISGAVPGFDSAPETFRNITQAYVDNPVIWAGARQRFIVETLYTRSPAIAVCDDFDFGLKKSVLSFSLSDLENLRKSSLEKALHVECHNGDRVFLRRGSGARTLNNELELIDIARDLGFQIVDPAKISWLEQIALFRDAKIVAGSGGAVMANYLFASEGTKIVQLVAEQNASFSPPVILGHASNSEVFSIVGRSKPLSHFPSPPIWHHANFFVPREQAREGLRSIIGNGH